MYLNVTLVWSESVVAARQKRNSNSQAFGPQEDCYDFLTHLSNVARELEACQIANPRLKNTIKFDWEKMVFIFSLWEDGMSPEQQLLQKWFVLRRWDLSDNGKYLFNAISETLTMDEYDDIAGEE